jgi:class I fructose-bisphosphate aldolase
MIGEQKMLTTHINKLLTDSKTLMLAYDQGMEHGPSTDLNLDNVDPDYIIEIAEKGGYNALILHNGIAEKYYQHLKTKLPLIIKLNGKTNIPKIEPFATQICSLKRAVNLGAHAVGYTVYVGSNREAEMFSQFSKIVEEAHDYSIPVIMWAYPRGQSVHDPLATETLAYAARVGLELGADFVKIGYNNDPAGFKWVVKSAGKTKVIVAGGDSLPERAFLQKAADILEAGAIGMAVGREVWQHKEPLIMTEAIKKVIFDGDSVDEAMKLFPNK